jgi:hypothetical protein
MPSLNGHPAYNYAHFSGAGGPTTIKNGQGFLRTLTVNDPVASGTITLADGTNTLAVVTLPATAGNPFSLIYDLMFFTSLIITTTGTGLDVTVAFE